MRKSLPLAALAIVLALGTAEAGLTTRSMDAVEAEVTAREAALTGDLTKQDKKLRAVYRAALKYFAKDSTSRTKDAKWIGKIARKLSGKTLRSDADFQALVHGGVDAFVNELDGSLVHVRRGNDLVDGDNKHDAKSEKYFAKAQARIALTLEQESMGKKLKYCMQAEAFTRKSRTWVDKALDLETGLSAHQRKFLREMPEGYTGTQNCLDCHATVGAQMLQAGHHEWKGVSANIEGHETHEHGKIDLLNNFCIAIPSNEGRCTQCHTGYGWKDKDFDFTDASKVDCLICHDTTGTYQKDLKTGGLPVPGIDLTAVALSVGEPGRSNCLPCHANAGGGDNVKHGDLASTIGSTTREFDVHMGTDGGNFTCQRCHTSSDHGIAGNALHSQDEGTTDCTDCHTGNFHGGILDTHTQRIACQTCHIPAFSRSLPTKMEWYWGDAGQDISPIPTDEYGKATYNKMKGTFVWQKDVKPELRWFNGKWRRALIGDADTYTELPANLADPVGSKDDPTAKIYPFKKMIGNQPADTVNQRIIVPHLFGMGPGPNPYWVKYDWAAALAEGAAYAGQPYSGTYGFVDTVMYLSVNHEIAPKAQARTCNDCHNGGIDFTALGYAEDPASAGQ